MTQQMLALNANWTDAPVTLTNSGNVVTLSTVATNAAAGNYTSSPVMYNTGWYCEGYWYPYYRPFPPTYWTTITDRRPIRLTMAEVERLRVAAKKDKALKATLEKFTDHIEVIVDFGKAA